MDQMDQAIRLDPMYLAGVPAARVASAPGAPLPSLLGPDARTAASVRNSLREDALSDLDTMLIGDPNVGAVHGVRVALLFNAGVALSGIVAWEVWSMLFH